MKLTEIAMAWLVILLLTIVTVISLAVALNVAHQLCPLCR